MYSVILESLSSNSDLKGVVGAISNILNVDKKGAVEKAKKLPLVLSENLSEKEAKLMADMFGSMGAGIKTEPPFANETKTEAEIAKPISAPPASNRRYSRAPQNNNGMRIAHLAIMFALIAGFAAFASLKYEWIIALFKPSPAKAEKLLQNGNMNDARKSIKKQLRGKPNDVDLLMLQGKFYLGLARKKMDSEHWKSYGERGSMPEVDSAVAFLRKAESLNPKESEIYRWISTAEQMRLNLPAAEVAARRAVSINPSDPDNWNQLGAILTDDEQTSQAEQAFYNALKIDANNIPALKNLVILNLYYTKDGERAATFLFSFLSQKGAQNDVDSYQLRIDLAAAMIGDFNPPWQKLLPPALPFDEYERRRIMLSGDPNIKRDPLLNEQLGILYLSRGDEVSAEDSFIRAIQLNSNVESSRKMLSIMYLKQGQYEKALKTLEAAADRGSKDPFFWKNLGVLQKFYKADKEAAVKSFNKYFSLGGDSFASRVRKEM